MYTKFYILDSINTMVVVHEVDKQYCYTCATSMSFEPVLHKTTFLRMFARNSLPEGVYVVANLCWKHSFIDGNNIKSALNI